MKQTSADDGFFSHERAEFAVPHDQTYCSISLQTRTNSQLFPTGPQTKSILYFFTFLASAAKRQHRPALGPLQATKRQREGGREQKKREEHSQSYLSGANKDKLQQQKGPSESGDLHHVVPDGSRGGSPKSFSLGFAGSEEPRRKQPHGLRFGYLVCPSSQSHQGLMYIHTMLYAGRCFSGRAPGGGARAHTGPIGRVSGGFNLCCEPQ